MPDDSLEQFVASVCGESHLRVETDLGDGFVRLRSSEAERRQAAQDIRCSEDIVIEMLRNARDANARNIFVATGKEGTLRRLVMIDDGDGVPEHLQTAIFEPRVTSKLDTMHMDKWGVHGRGMALYSISVNAKSARLVASGKRLGSSFVIESDTSKLGEKTDQSTFPIFERKDEGNVVVRGPKNIIRTACEFAIESRNRCNVFMGSATEIAAVLLAYGRAVGTIAVSGSSAHDPSERKIPVCRRLACAHDPASFRREAEMLGLVMSERSARRVLDGTIAPIDALIEQIVSKNPGMKAASPSEPKPRKVTRKHPKAIQLSDEDRSRFASDIVKAYGRLADSYYLNADVDADVKVTKDVIHITIPVVSKE